MTSIQQDEGEALARKNGELEAALRRTRAACRESDAEADRLAGRAGALEAQVGCVSGCVRYFCVLCRLVYGQNLSGVRRRGRPPRRPRRGTRSPADPLDTPYLLVLDSEVSVQFSFSLPCPMHQHSKVSWSRTPRPIAWRRPRRALEAQEDDSNKRETEHREAGAKADRLSGRQGARSPSGGIWRTMYICDKLDSEQRPRCARIGLPFLRCMLRDLYYPPPPPPLLKP